MSESELLGLPLEEACGQLRSAGYTDVQTQAYVAPGRQAHGSDMRVLQARLGDSCATLVYAGFRTNVDDED